MNTDRMHKVPTFIDGLDAILAGGLPQGRVTALVGGPGSGKSVFTLETAVRNAERGTPSLFYSFEQSAEEIETDAKSFGWPVDALKESRELTIQSGNLDHVEVAGDVDVLEGLLVMIKAAAEEGGVRLVALDALDTLLDFLPHPEHLRQLRRFCDELKKAGLTVVLTVKKEKQRQEEIDFLVDCVIALDQRISEQISTRRLRVSKIRGSSCGRNEYPFVINSNGASVIPITLAGLKHGPLGDFMSTGIHRLDGMLGGGVRRGSCVIVSGTPGTAKTTLAATFAAHRCRKGERTLYIDFEQSADAFAENVLSVGVDLGPMRREGSFVHSSFMPEAFGAEEHLVNAFELIERLEPAHVVVDSISACKRMGSQRAAYEYAFRLMDRCKRHGITCILLNQTAEFMDMTQLSGIEISSMVDSAIALNFIHSGAELNRVMLVLKSRGANHSNQFREFAITGNGIEILDVCLEKDGKLLTGTARQAEEEATTAARQIKLSRKLQLERELDELKLELKTEDAGRTLRGEMRRNDIT